MTDIIIQGFYGRMGRALQEKIAARGDCRVVAGIDKAPGAAGAVPVYAALSELPENCRGVIIDFSGAAGAVEAARYAAGHGLPCVICSTGLSKADEAVLEAASEKIPLFRSANMSLGVNVLIELCRRAVTLFGGEFDIEIVEKHHHSKLDAPSGTALMIADAINAQAGGQYIIIQGFYGRMGRALQEKIAARGDCRVVAGIDKAPGAAGAVPVYAALSELPENCRGVIIDFSGAAGAVEAARYAAGHGLPCVICSTGLSKADEAVLEAASEKIPLFRSANMSLGVNVLIELCRRAVTLFGGEFDIEIVEKHHHSKLDAPSGTALMIADAINAQAGGQYTYIYDRHDVRQPRGAQELGISAVRGGGIVGDHDVLFCGPEEVVTLSHRAQSRGVFADGAVQAALFLDGQTPGYYTMSDLLRGKLACI